LLKNVKELNKGIQAEVLWLGVYTLLAMDDNKEKWQSNGGVTCRGRSSDGRHSVS
jgi:hypothetical protein